MSENGKTTAVSMNSVRFMLLAACYSTSMAAIIVSLPLTYTYLMEFHAKLDNAILALLIIVSFTAISQLVFNERLLAPIERYFKFKDSLDAKKTSIIVFLLLISMFFLSLGIAKLALPVPINFLRFSLVAFIAALTASGALWITLQAKSDDPVELNEAVDATLSLPLYSASFSLMLWVIAGPAMYLSLHYLAGMGFMQSFAIGGITVCAGAIAFPAQYFVFKRVIDPLYESFLGSDSVQIRGDFRVSLSRKLMATMLSMIFFSVGFLGLLNYLKASDILREQAGTMLHEMLLGMPTSDVAALKSSIETTTTNLGAYPFLFENSALVTQPPPDKYSDLLAILSEGNAEKIRKAWGDDLLVHIKSSDGRFLYGMIYPGDRFSPLLAKVRKSVLSFAALTLAIVFGLAYMVSRDIGKPIQTIRREILDFAAGNEVKQSNRLFDDEMADLSDGFKDMASSIRRQLGHSTMLIDNLKMTVQHLGSSAGEMEAISKEQAAGSAEQAAAIQEALTTASEIAASARHIAESAVTVDSVIADTQTNCVSSADLITHTIQGMDEVRETVDKVAHRMLELGGRSQRIGAAVDIIEEISEQTNLLSLNASIEASSAGEEGRRFGVVAREIRRLAEGTVEASRQIKLLISEIQKSTNEAIVQVEESTKAVEKWAGQVAQVGDAFQNIESLVESATRAVKEIKTNTRQQTTACEQMAEVIAEVKEVADRVVSSAKETESSMTDLSDLTKNLKEIISTEEKA